MIDLTPLEVRLKKGDFRRGFRGYDQELVNDFLDLVADRMEELVKENMELRDSVESLEAAENIEVVAGYQGSFDELAINGGAAEGQPHPAGGQGVRHHGQTGARRLTKRERRISRPPLHRRMWWAEVAAAGQTV